MDIAHLELPLERAHLAVDLAEQTEDGARHEFHVAEVEEQIEPLAIVDQAEQLHPQFIERRLVEDLLVLELGDLGGALLRHFNPAIGLDGHGGPFLPRNALADGMTGDSARLAHSERGQVSGEGIVYPLQFQKSRRQHAGGIGRPSPPLQARQRRPPECQQPPQHPP